MSSLIYHPFVERPILGYRRILVSVQDFRRWGRTVSVISIVLEVVLG